MQFVGNGTIGPSDANGAQGIGSAFNSIASSLMDGGQQQMRALALAKAARYAAGSGNLGDVFAGGAGADAATALRNGASLSDVLGAQGAWAAQHQGVDSALLNENLAAAGKFPQSPLYQGRALAATSANEAAARAGAPIDVIMPDGSLKAVTQSTIPAGAQPVVGTDLVKGAISQHNLLPQPGGVGSVFASPAAAPTAVAGNMPGATPAPDAAAPDAAAPVMSADQRTLIGLDKADKTLNYQILGPDGKQIAAGRTVDGIHDMTTGEKLPQNATIMGTGQGGVTVNNTNGAETAEQSAVGKAKGDLLGKVISNGEDARTRMSLLSQIAEASKAGGDNITTGPLAEYVMKGKEALGSAFGTQLDGTAPAEVINKLGFQLATQLTKAISSRPTQAEFLRALQNVPGLAQSPQGRDALISLSMQQSKAESDLAGIAANSKSYAEYKPQEDAYYAAHPLVSPFTGKPFGAEDVAMVPGAAAPAASAAPAAGGNVTPNGVKWSVVH
jgi:hypothetical protein